MRRLLRPASVLVVLASVASGAIGVTARQLPGQAATTASPPAGLIVGRAVDGTTGKALGGVILTLSVSITPGATPDPTAPPATLSRFPARVISDDTGQFVFREIPKGSYTLTASKPGYVDGVFGRRAAADQGSQPLTLADNERRSGVSVSLWKYATLGGTVTDEAGEPVIGLQVRVLRRAVVGGRLRYTQFGNMPTTDDRGVYRAASLTPGDYVVGIVTTQTSVPLSLVESTATAMSSGDMTAIRREIDRSAGILRGDVLMATGQRVGSWLLQTPMGPLGGGDATAPPTNGGKVFVYPMTFYPAAATPARATIVALAPAEDRLGVDFQLKPVPTWRVSGQLIGLAGPEASTTLDLLPAAADDLQRDYDFAAAATITDATGAFTFLGVAPGSYTIRVLKVPARPVTQTSSMTTVIQTGSTTIVSSSGPTAPAPIPNEPTLWASVPVSVETSDVTNVAVTLRTGGRISGRVEFDGAAAPPAPDRLVLASVTIDPADGRTASSNQFTLARGVIDVSGRFNTYQLVPGKYVVRASGSLPGWTFKNATLDGRDISDTPLDLTGDDVSNVVVTFTDRPTELTGTVRDSKGADPLATVLVFPAEPARWANHGTQPRRFRSLRAGTDGAFRIVSLPPGDYSVVALHSVVPAEWMDGAFLQKLAPIAVRVTLADGAKSSRDLESREIR